MPWWFGSIRQASDSCSRRVKRQWTLLCTISATEICNLLVLPVEIIYTSSVMLAVMTVRCLITSVQLVACLNIVSCCDSSGAAFCIAL